MADQEPESEEIPELETIRGIGGIFFKSKDPKSLQKWYESSLGMKVDAYGKRFEWQEVVTSDSSRMEGLQWSVFAESSDYFDPSKSSFMINYVVADIDQLVLYLEKNNVVFTDSVIDYGYGKFVHIMDPEGNKIELYEPNYDFEMQEE
ncbi:MAG: VOC family protein [Crocinitomicaceae bacterium]|nr:VOC family protein [Crocinitomicaceae bacterium]